MSVNRVILVGRLGANPEVRQTNSGSIVTMKVATSDRWRDKQSGEMQEKTEWHNVVVLNEQLSRIAGEYLKKGSQVYLEGSLHTRKWVDKEGHDRYSTEVVLGRFKSSLTILDSVGGGRGQDRSQQRGGYQQRSAAPPRQQSSGGGWASRGQEQQRAAPKDDDLSDDVPF